METSFSFWLSEPRIAGDRTAKIKSKTVRQPWTVSFVTDWGDDLQVVGRRKPADGAEHVVQPARQWKNLGAGAPVTLWLRGEERSGQAVVAPLARGARLAAMLAVYRGMPRRLAEQQVEDMIVIEINLDAAGRGPEALALAEVEHNARGSRMRAL